MTHTADATTHALDAIRSRAMNVYIVWSEHEYNADYYLFIAARTPSAARLEYARFGGWEGDYFDKQPADFTMHCHLIEKDAPYEHSGELWDYVEAAGVDLILSGVLSPMWRVDGFDASDEYDYRRCDGFRKPHAAATDAGKGTE